MKYISKQQDNIQDNKLSYIIMWKKRALVTAVAGVLFQINTPVLAGYASYDDAGNPSSTHPIGDLEIYASPQNPGAVVMMMLDASGSMGYDPAHIKNRRWKNPANATVTGYGYAYRQIAPNRFMKAEYPSYDINTDFSSDSCTRPPYAPNTQRAMWELNTVNNTMLLRQESNGYIHRKSIIELGNGYTKKLKSSVVVDGVTIEYDLDGCAPGSWAAAANQTNVIINPSTAGDYTGPESRVVYDETGAEVTEDRNYSVRSRIWEKTADWQTSWDVKDLTRISRLKDALIQSLGEYTQADVTAGVTDINGDPAVAGEYRIASQNLLGVGAFGQNGFNTRGKILAATKELTPGHRKNLINKIKILDANGSTPVTVAYFEALAYLQGKQTTGKYTTSSKHNTATGHIANTQGYIKPAKESKYSCYGRGIYFLTDGVPASTNKSVKDSINTLMSKTPTKGGVGLPLPTDESTAETGWNYIGAMSREINTKSTGAPAIRTATVGFGSTFQDFAKTETQNYKNITAKDGTIISIPDCDKINVVADPSKIHEKNLCNWGSKENYTEDVSNPGIYTVSATDKLWGAGGFTYASVSKDISDSLEAFMQEPGSDLNAKPSGTILIPEDPFKGNSITPYAYVPMVQPYFADPKQVWVGNLKKYNTANGTLFGKGDKRLYTSLTASSDGGQMKDETADIWDDTARADGHKEVKSGGFYARLKGPTPNKVEGYTRNVYVESYTGNSDTGFERIVTAGASDIKAPVLSTVKDNVYGGTDLPKLKAAQRTILNFMGFNIPSDNTFFGGSIKLNKTAFLPVTETRSLGAIVHSKPALVAYSANVDADGRIATTANSRDEYLFFGSMDGTLHMVDADTGEEKWALILQEMFRKQSGALIAGSGGKLKFGVDAPWLVSAKYNYSGIAAASSGSTAQVKLYNPTTTSGGAQVPDADLLDSSNYVAMAAYGGFRLGSRGLYALNLTEKDKPTVLFKITADNTVYNTSSEAQKLHKHASGASIIDTGTEYDKVGYIWSKPTMARLVDKTLDVSATPTATTKKPKDVIIFGGGYDLSYEKTDWVPGTVATRRTLGSAVYIADAKTGDKIWSWENPENHSIVGEITTLDRDNDGYFDHLYFADLGGNLFRADFINNKNNGFGAAPRSGSVPSVTKILDTNAGTGPAYRFYNRPVVSFYTDERDDIFALVNISSGDRSSPLSNKRTTLASSNRVYGIIDREVTTKELLSENNGGIYPTPTFKDITESDLVELGGANLSAVTAESTDVNRIDRLCEAETTVDGKKYILDAGEKKFSPKCKKKVSFISQMLNLKPGSTTRTEKDGWYYPLTGFNGYEKVKNIKSVGESSVISSRLYLSAYDSSTIKKSPGVCDAVVRGATEVQLYCLPYGVCMDDSATTGMGGFTPAGAGIQELTFGSYDKDNTEAKVLITTASLQETINNTVGYGGGPAAGNNKAKKGKVDESGKVGGTDGVHDNHAQSTPIHGEGSLPPTVTTQKYELAPKQWYEVIE